MVSLAEGLEPAVAIVRQEREKLVALLRRARRTQSELQSRLTQTERALEHVSQRIAALQGEAAKSEAQSMELVCLREQEHSLRQQRTGLRERLVTQAAIVHRLRIVSQQAQMNLEFLTGTFVPVAIDVPATETSDLRALQAQEDERRRLAREIHDGPAQVLVNAVTELEYCRRVLERDPSAVSQRLETIANDLRDGLADLRSFIFDLRPGPLAEVGLVATVRRFARSYESRFGIAVALDLDEEVDRQPIEREFAVFRIVQEALQNVRKHSGARQVRVSIHQEEGALVAQVSDNGSGFDPSQVEEGRGRHFGLMSMYERARLAHADLYIDTALGRGTTITVRLPLEQRAEEAREADRDSDSVHSDTTDESNLLTRRMEG